MGHAALGYSYLILTILTDLLVGMEFGYVWGVLLFHAQVSGLIIVGLVTE